MLFFRRSTYRHLDDQDLIRLYTDEKKSDVIGVLYERYGHLVMGVCLKYLRDEQDAQDLCSKVFEELGHKLIKHPVSYFKSWLYQLVKNECLMFLRKNTPYFVSSDAVADHSDDDENSAEKEDQIRTLENAFTQLNTLQATCVRLFYLNDLSYQDISLQLEIPLNQVKSHIQNGKRNLKQILSKLPEFNENQ